ncbi:DUF4131 domain-containing protein [Candidatus Coxiella mudrowiae]|uniref:DUF4131 domain-containing protein n=1 Tax=Candidatus Coxiella mudrowiae TaxID=2054173 RepID=UPI0009E49771|nr:DUF4131 domain-containing protein [Candidatus Coxiella mudrowiae]
MKFIKSQKKQSSFIRLNWYGKHLTLRVDDCWCLVVKLELPDGLSNPGGFNYQRWLFINSVRATSSVINRMPFKLLKRSPWEEPMSYLGQSAQTAIQKGVKNPELVSLLSALTVGS